MSENTDFLSLVNNRYSCRKFTSEPLKEEEITQILEAARVSPTAKNNQPVRICIVKSQEGLAKIDECTKCRYNAPVALIIAYDADVAAHLVEPFGPDTCNFGDIDATIAITNMENEIESIGLGSCWIGAFDKIRTRELFNVPDNYKLVELMMVGHKDADPSPRHEDRQPIDAMTAYETF